MSGVYCIVGEIYAHDGPIRSLSAGTEGQIVSGCQSDSPNAKKWTITENSLEQIGQPIFHDHWVTAVTSCSRRGFTITGCMDCKIRVLDSSNNQIMILSGHEKGVISFSWTANGCLISGSWDGTAKVWDLDRNGQLINSLGPHENGVNVLGLHDGRIATTSTGEAVNGKPANFKLRLWDSGTGTLIGDGIADHSGSIRSIISVPGLDGFATTSNDGTVALRSSDGSIMGSMMHPPQEDGSPPFVLGCSLLCTATGMSVVSGAEDGSVMVCDGMEVIQNIPHPTCVWCVLGVPNTAGDFITGGHDGVLRYFSRNIDATKSEASRSLQAAFLDQVDASLAKKRKGPSNEEIAKQVKWEASGGHPGKSDGQVMVFNKDGKMIAAQWSSDSATWIEIGEVTGNGDGGQVNGVQYDHILPVEIDTPSEGVKCLNIGYNNLESAYDAAQRFIDENGLGQHYLRQIADWITDRAGKNTPTLGATNNSAMTTPAAVKTYQYFPVKAYSLYDDIIPGFQGKIMPKITEFNSEAGEKSLTTLELEAVDQSVSVLTATSRYHSSSIIVKQLNGIMKMAVYWDAAKSFPAFDLCRMLGLHPNGSKSLASHPMFQDLLSRALQLLRAEDTPANATVTTLKFLVNSFRFDELRNAVMMVVPIASILDIVEKQSKNSNKLVRVGASSLLLNCTVQLILSPSTMDPQRLLLGRAALLSHNLLTNETESVEVINRSLFTFGTISITTFSLPLSSTGTDLIAYIKSMSLPSKLSLIRSQWAGKLGDQGLGCLEELTQLLSQ